MSLRSLAATAALALVGTLLGAGPSGAAQAGVQLVFDTWAPSSTGSTCAQVVGFSLTPEANSSTVAPTGTVRLTEDGETLGTVAVNGFGTYKVASSCAPDNTARSVALVYSGDATYATRTTASPGACGRDLRVPDQATWNASVSVVGKPQPVFSCRGDNSGWMRAADGRSYLGAGYFGSISPPLSYGGVLDFFFDFDLDTMRSFSSPAAATGTVVASVDGVAQRTIELTEADTDYGFRWNVDTTRLKVGTHRLSVRYSGDAKFVPAEMFTYSFKLGKGRMRSTARLKKTFLGLGQRPVVTLTMRPLLNRKAAAPTGKVTFYFDGRRVKTVTFRAKDRGRRTVTLPALRKRGKYGWHSMEFVYSGDARYLRAGRNDTAWTDKPNVMDPQRVGRIVPSRFPQDRPDPLRHAWTDL